MSCYSCGGNPNTFCGECVNNRDTWITLVDALPDVFMGDFDHLFRTPNGNLYALSPDRTQWIQVNGSGGGNSTTYKAGDGIEITQEGTINNTKPNKLQTLSIEGRNITISDGNSIFLPESLDSGYDDSALREKVDALASKVKVYSAKGNGLILNSDNSFQLDIATNRINDCPYKTNGSRNIPLTSELRYDNQLKNSLSYALDNDGTEYKGTVTEAGVVFNFEGHLEYEGNTPLTLSGNNFILNGVTTNSTTVSELASTYIDKQVKLEVELDASWKDSNNKVAFSFKPKLIWEVKLESHTEYYVHNLTKEEFDSSEPIEVEVKRGESVIGRLNLTLKNVRVYLQSPQDRIVLKNPTDNKYYYVPRLG